MSEAWLTIGEIERRTQIPDRTLRRYIGLHGQHFKTKRDGRHILVAEETIQVLIRIRDWYAAGWNLQRVEDALTQSGLPVMVTVDDRKEPVLMSAVEVIQLMRSEVAAAMTDVTERLRSLQIEVATTREENAQLRRELDERQELLEGRMAERDRKLTEALIELREEREDWKRAVEQPKKYSWWPFGR